MSDDVVITAIQTDVDDGSQLENVKWIENQIKKNSEMLASGSTAEFDTLKNTFKQRGFDIVKKRECKENNNMPNIEAARIRHHATLPLLKNWKHKNLHYFVFPYMENGELLKAIADDFNRIQTEEKVQMNATRRVLILYKIACAMLFIHTDLRKKMFHGHITSENIVLDENYNPRLRFTSQKQLPTESDLRDFGVLILEMLTGLTGEDSDLKERPLPDVDQFKRQFKECFENVWKDESIVYEDLFSLANECWKKTCEASLITTKLYDMLEGLNHTWENVASRKNRKCSLCTLNPIAEDTNLNLQNCMSTLSHVSPSVCVACMRDSYLNPIQCLRCRETIHTKIGSNMEAILISGYDEKMESRKTFENDVEKVKNILTSKYPLVFGISEDRVTTTLLRKFIEEKLTLKESTTTVLVYYTGHHDMDKGFLYDKNSFFTEKVFAACLESIKMDVVLIMDCCYATKFELKNVKLQLNASQCDKPAACFPNQHSLFTKLLYQSLYFEPTVSCVLGVTCRACLKYRSNDVNSGLIYLETLFCYINEHIELYKKENPAIVGTPTIHINAKDPIDFVFGYKHEREGISFFHEDEYINECTIYRLPSEKELKTELFKYSLRNRYKGDFVEKHGDKWRNFSDVIAITKRRYPHETDTHELSNIDEVIEASNMQFKLFFGIRNVKYLRNNSKVGVFFDVDKVNTQEILRIFSNSELFDVKLNNEMKQTVFKIPWRKVIEDKTRTELAKLKPTKIQNQDVAYEWVCGTLESIKLNPNIKPPAHVVFTVPSGLWGEDINDFLTIELEGLELQI